MLEPRVLIDHLKNYTAWGSNLTALSLGSQGWSSLFFLASFFCLCAGYVLQVGHISVDLHDRAGFLYTAHTEIRAFSGLLEILVVFHKQGQPNTDPKLLSHTSSLRGPAKRYPFQENSD